MGKPLSRPGCFRKSSCCLEKHGFGADVGVGGRDVSVDGGYGDGYVPQRSIYDTMCINQQIDSHHHHHGGSMRCDAGSDSSFYSTSGSLRMSRAPGSHPPSSAASELSLTELERRARELDSDLEHLDLSQPHRESEELYPPLHDSRERTDMYQTHPGPRDKTSAMTVTIATGVVGSRSHVNLELSSPSGDTDRPPSGVSPAKEDSSPDSNLTLESDSSGIFLSLSNQSHEEGGSDSDQPISGSDLGSSSTSLDKDGEDGLKEWGREESAELQWCYPSLLNTSMQDEDNNGNLQEEVKTGVNVPIITAPIDQNASEDQPPRRKVTVMGGESPLCRSPINQSTKHQIDQIKKPFRTSGLDCSDIDPFAQADSFVYLAVSARPSSHGEVMVKGSEFKKEMAPMQAEVTTQLSQSKALQEVKGMQLGVQKPEEGDFLCTDSFVYLAAPACFLLGPPGTAGYSGRDSDSESSDSCPVDVSVHGCGSVAEDSDWDSDLSDSDPSRPPRSSSGTKASGTSRSKRPPPEPQWDLYKDPPEPECIENLEGAPSSPNSCPSPTDTSPGSADSSAASKRVTWQFKPAQRSVCTGSRKEKDVTSSGSDRPPPSPSSSSSSPSSSSSG
uniref:Uncharacterized protein n=1 Tax=Knipowitschia caucasica TaxID=637954 RepID=A0AAV2JKC1_KNICA